MEKTKIEDIYKGKHINIWKEDEWYYISTPLVTLHLLEEDFNDFIKEMKKACSIILK